jgi:iron complex outermembrane receptor protein
MVSPLTYFITKKNFEGVEAGGDFKYIDGSDGNWNAFINAGWSGDRAQWFVSGGFQHKSQLSARERDWAIQPYLGNPQGGWSAFGNPSSYLPFSATGTPLAGVTRDPQCNNVGAVAGFSGATPVCFFNFTRFDNLVENEDRYQVFSSFDLDLAPNHKFHAEGLYTNTVTPDWLTSPAYITLQTPGAFDPARVIPGFYVTPASNPFYQDFIAKNPGALPASTALVGLVVLSSFVLG